MFAGANTASANPAASSLTLCNQMSDHVRIAVGYFTSGVNDSGNVLSGPFASRGWWRVEPGQCQTLDNPFNARYMFWFAFANGLNDDQAAIASARTDQKLHFCITNYFTAQVPGFTYEDENTSMAACDQAGSTFWVVPRKVDTFIESSVNITGP
jgi:uncharacterized membrane protein